MYAAESMDVKKKIIFKGGENPVKKKIKRRKYESGRLKRTFTVTRFQDRGSMGYFAVKHIYICIILSVKCMAKIDVEKNGPYCRNHVC